jgi:hypothetical protein
MRIAAIAAALTLSTAAHAGQIQFHGCEANDVHAMIAEGPTEWFGAARQIGPWSFRNSVNLWCGDTSCEAAPRAMAAVDPAMDLAGAPGTLVRETGSGGATLRVIEGPAAQALRANLGEAAFTGDGALRRVWMDYGALAGGVSLRIRNEIACELGADRCTVATDPLVFVSYSDEVACGDAAADAAQFAASE